MLSAKQGAVMAKNIMSPEDAARCQALMDQLAELERAKANLVAGSPEFIKLDERCHAIWIEIRKIDGIAGTGPVI